MDLFQTKSFKAMESSMNALQLQMQISKQNLANISTPGYKAKKISFKDVLARAGSEPNTGKYDFKAFIETEEDTVVRPDGNNVDLEIESARLNKAYYQYSYLTSKLTGQISNLKYVLENAPK